MTNFLIPSQKNHDELYLAMFDRSIYFLHVTLFRIIFSQTYVQLHHLEISINNGDFKAGIIQRLEKLIQQKLF